MVSKLKNFLLNFEALASLLLRFGIGIAFIIHGYAKFPLPPAGLVEYFGSVSYTHLTLPTNREV